MSFSWKQYEGQVINNTFPLQRYLGGSSESAVFLTQLAGPQSSKAVLKLIPEGASVDLQLSLWRRASKLTHPNLLQLYQGGRCRLADMDLLYVFPRSSRNGRSRRRKPATCSAWCWTP